MQFQHETFKVIPHFFSSVIELDSQINSRLKLVPIIVHDTVQKLQNDAESLDLRIKKLSLRAICKKTVTRNYKKDIKPECSVNYMIIISNLWWSCNFHRRDENCRKNISLYCKTSKKKVWSDQNQDNSECITRKSNKNESRIMKIGWCGMGNSVF